MWSDMHLARAEGCNERTGTCVSHARVVMSLCVIAHAHAHARVVMFLSVIGHAHAHALVDRHVEYAIEKDPTC